MSLEVVYLELPNGEKLISYHRHDYKSRVVDGNFYMIDGGQDDYIRCSAPIVPFTWWRKILNFLKIKSYVPNPQLKTCDVSECFDQVRNEFKWGSNYNKEGELLNKTVYRPLKELDDEHLGLLIDNYTQGFIQKIMIEEQLFREKVKEYIKLN